MKTILYMLEPRESISITVTNICDILMCRCGIEVLSHDTKRGIIELNFARIIVDYHNRIYTDGLRVDEIFGHYPSCLAEQVLKNPHGARFIGDIYDYLHLLNMDNQMLEAKKFKIKKVIFNPPATIVLWEDGTKTVVKAQDEDFDPEKGLAMAISKKALGNKGNYCNEIKKWTEQYMPEEIENGVLNFEFTFAPDGIEALKKPTGDPRTFAIETITLNGEEI